MLTDDVPVWFAYLEQYQDRYKTVYYNVAMTSLDPGDIPGIPSMVNMWLYAISKRVDVMASTGSEIHIIEVTRRAAIRSFGQAVMYKELYDLVKPFTLPPTSMIVCHSADPDVIHFAPKFGITVVQLQPLSLQQVITTLVTHPT